VAFVFLNLAYFGKVMISSSIHLPSNDILFFFMGE
jgi:hypothetical protein